MTLKKFIRRCLETGLTAEQAWRKAEAERYKAPWNYVNKIHRDWKREQEPGKSDV